MADRRVKLILEADASQHNREMQGAARAAEGVKESAQGIGKEWSNASRNMQGDMRTVGSGFAAVGASILGVYGSLVSTGIEYNTLQQVAGRSLEVVMGSASGAADQMERLHEFADTSPFARQTWIEAQMQLTAFGMEAERVVPTLDAIQNAVAAIGGGDAEIMRIVDILGAVEGQGRFTGRELQRLGMMGIDAAEMMGAAMGVSGEEIRTQITAGALDAETAIEALTTGMMMRFDGAAEGMRETMTGAWDRLKAAWRDLGSVLATPLVDPNGGGGLVWLTNAAADLLRAIERIPDPILQTVGAMAGLAGVAMLGYGAMLLLVPKIVAFREAKARLATAMPKTNQLMGNLTKIAGAAATAFIAYELAVLAARAITADFTFSAAQANRQLEWAINNSNEFNGSAVAFQGNLGGIGRGFDDLGEAMQKVTSDDLIDNFARTGSSITGISNSMSNATEVISGFDGAVSEMVSTGNLDGAAESMLALASEADAAGVPFTTLAHEHFPMLDDALAGAGITMDEFMAAIGRQNGYIDAATGKWVEGSITLEELASRMSNAEAEALGLAGGSAELEAALADVGLAADGTVDSLETFLDVLYRAGLLTMSARDAQANYEKQLDDTKAAVEELTKNSDEMGRMLNENATDFDITTEAGRQAQDQFHGIARSGMDLTQALAENGATQGEVQDALRQTYNDLINAGKGMGMTKGDARDLTREVLGIPDNVDIDTWLESTAEDQAKSLKAALDANDGRQTWSSHTHTVTRKTHNVTWNQTSNSNRPPGFSRGGAVFGPGTTTSDDIHALLSRGEHVLTARDVQALGGQQGVYQMRSSLHSPSTQNMVSAYQPGQARQAQQFAEAVRAGGGADGGTAPVVNVDISMKGALVGSREIARHMARDISEAIQSQVVIPGRKAG